VFDTLPQARAADSEGPGNYREVVITIAELGEFGLIAAITTKFGDDVAGLEVGVGDDAAVILAPDGRVVATTDMLIEGRHFRRDWSSAADIGHKAAARNLADIAAMGAVPIALLVGFAGPGHLAVEWVLDLAAGIAAECSVAGAKVAGGDTSRAELVIVSITALGDLGGAAPVRRSGARPGDVVAIAGAGSLGAAAAGLALVESGVLARQAEAGLAASPELLDLVNSHRRPRPPYAAGPEAVRLGATSMIDVSDGLIADLGHVADASGVLIDLTASKLAVEPVARPAALRLAASQVGASDWLTWVLTGGDDHVLVATFPADVVLPASWSEVGTVTKGHGVALDGQIWSGTGGWDHFRS
jgi:thiamine-monophosphate kinase